MIEAGALQASASSPGVRLSPRTVLAAWRAITPRQIAVTFLLGAALFVFHMLVNLALITDWFVFVADQIKVFPMLLTFAVADYVVSRDQDRRGAYVIAALVGTAVAAPTAVIWNSYIVNLLYRPATPRAGFMVYIGLETVMLGAAILWIINDRRRAERARARMHRAELERIAAEKRSIESDLQALQARVEPQFLFNTLAQVKGLYEHSAERGEQMLDQLIGYLRAAMPRMRAASSTIGQELDLARAYLAIVKVRAGEWLQFSVDASANCEYFRFPPMLLLPLIDHAIQSMPDTGSALRTIRIVAGIEDARVRLAITDSGGGLKAAGASDDFAHLRERLSGLYGAEAHLRVSRSDDGATTAQVDVPLQRPADEESPV
jgi:hypothetical protein